MMSVAKTLHKCKDLEMYLIAKVTGIEFFFLLFVTVILAEEGS